MARVKSWGVAITAWVDAVCEPRQANVDPSAATLEAVEASEVRCPDPEAAARFTAAIEAARDARDSVGGVDRLLRNGDCPPAGASPSSTRPRRCSPRRCSRCPAAKGFEIGSGFRRYASARLPAQRRLRRRDPTAAWARPPTAAAASRAGSPTANRWSCAWPSSRPPRSARPQVSADFEGNAGHRRGQGPPRSVRPAARRAHRRGDVCAGAGRSGAAASRPGRSPVRPVRRPSILHIQRRGHRAVPARPATVRSESIICGELLEIQALASVAERLLRHRMHLDHDSVRASGQRRHGQRRHVLAVARRMAGIDDHRQVALGS